MSRAFAPLLSVLFATSGCHLLAAYDSAKAADAGIFLVSLDAHDF